MFVARLRAPRPLCRAASRAASLGTTRGAFGGYFESEALPHALPRHQNSPQHPPYGLYPEQLSGTSFTTPRHKNRYAWLYRILPSVAHSPARCAPFAGAPRWQTPPFDAPAPGGAPLAAPTQLRFAPARAPAAPADFVAGVLTIAANGAPREHDGCAASVYSCDASMAATGRVLRNADADTLLLPQAGALRVRTEFGALDVAPRELCLVPRGVLFEVNLLGRGDFEGDDGGGGSGGGDDARAPADGVWRGYMLENFGEPFEVPDLGPIGISAGLAHPRHFEAPVASFDDDAARGERGGRPRELVMKYLGNLFHGPLGASPFDVVAWYAFGYAPVKYDMRRFCAINTVTRVWESARLRTRRRADADATRCRDAPPGRLFLTRARARAHGAGTTTPTRRSAACSRARRAARPARTTSTSSSSRRDGSSPRTRSGRPGPPRARRRATPSAPLVALPLKGSFPSPF